MIARRDPPEGPAQGEPLDPVEVLGGSRRPASRPASRRGVLLVLGILAFGAAFAALGYVLVKSIVARRQAAKEAKEKGTEEGAGAR